MVRYEIVGLIEIYEDRKAWGYTFRSMISRLAVCNSFCTGSSASAAGAPFSVPFAAAGLVSEASEYDLEAKDWNGDGRSIRRVEGRLSLEAVEIWLWRGVRSARAGRRRDCRIIVWIWGTGKAKFLFPLQTVSHEALRNDAREFFSI